MQVLKDIYAKLDLIDFMIAVMIVTVIGIVLVPKASYAGDRVKETNLLVQLDVIRTQLAFYQARNNGEYPALDTIWDDMKPYLLEAPVNAITGFSKVVNFKDGKSDSHGWEYNERNGIIQAVGYDEINRVITE